MEKYLIAIAVLLLMASCDSKTPAEERIFIIEDGFRGWVVLKIGDYNSVRSPSGVRIPRVGHAVIPSNAIPNKYSPSYLFESGDGMLIGVDSVGSDLIHGKQIYTEGDGNEAVNYYVFYVGSDKEYRNSISIEEEINRVRNELKKKTVDNQHK